MFLQAKKEALNQRIIYLFILNLTAIANEYTLDKEQTSYDDLLDALRLSLKGYRII